MPNNYYRISLNTLLTHEGIEQTQQILQSFVCERDADIQHFMHNNALNFAVQGIAKTFLIFTITPGKELMLVGVFTLAHKILTLHNDDSGISGRMWHRLSRFGAEIDDTTFEIPAPLIAQFAKNEACPDETQIDGAELMRLALLTVQEAQALIGGRAVYLECRNNPKVIDFYRTNGFTLIDNPTTSQLLRMIRYLPERATL